MKNSIYLGFPAVSLILYVLLLVVLLCSRKTKITKAYTLYILTNIVWSLGSLLMRTDLYPGPLFWNKILCVGFICMPIAFYYFTLVFTNSYQNHTNKRKLYIGYVSALILIILNFNGLIISNAYVQGDSFYYRLGPLVGFVVFLSLFFLINAFMHILEMIKNNKLPYIRVRFIVYGVMLLIAASLLNLIPALGKYPIDLLANAINALLIVYSTYRYEFLEIKLFIKKGLIYSTTTLIVTTLYITIVILIENNLRAKIGYTSIIPVALTAFVVALIFQPIKNRIQIWINAIFYRDELMQTHALRDFSIIINNILDINALSTSLLQATLQGLQPKKVLLMLRKNQKYHAMQSTDDTDVISEFVFDEDHPIIQWFMQKNNTFLTSGDIDRSPHFSSLWEAEKKQLAALDADLFIPIKLRDELTGLLVLSEKTNGKPYIHSDIDMLVTLVNNAALAIENAQLYSAAKKESITDSLTKLHNHRHFYEKLEETIHNNDIAIFSIIMIDVDHFKLFNDLYGHVEGDSVLEKIGSILMEHVKADDIVARYGGEEFAIISPDADSNEALLLAEKIRVAVENEFISSNNIKRFLTISLGVSCYPIQCKRKEDILKHADTALYAAKKNGKNQSIVYTPDGFKGIDIIPVTTIETLEDTMNDTYLSAIYALAATIDAKDHYTYGHSENVSKYGVVLAKAAGLDNDIIDHIKHAGLLHDIGKLGIPEHILTKPTSLTNEEFSLMKKHVDMSITIIKHIPNLIQVIPAILCHHEKYDGSGYPRGLKGDSIPIEGRCLCIVDAFDAMTSDRSYRKSLTVDEALQEIDRNKGIQFDPELSEIFIKLVKDGTINPKDMF